MRAYGRAGRLRLVLVSGLLAVLPFSARAASWVIWDDFERYAVSNSTVLSPWTVTGASGGADISVAVNDAQSPFGEANDVQGVRLVDATADYNPFMRQNFTLTAGQTNEMLVITFDVKFNTLAQQPCIKLFNGTMPGIILHLAMPGGQPQYNAGGTWMALGAAGSIETGKWYRYRLVVQPAATDPDMWSLTIVSHDGTSFPETTFSGLAFANQVTVFNRIEIMFNTGNESTGGDFLLDNVQVHATPTLTPATWYMRSNVTSAGDYWVNSHWSTNSAASTNLSAWPSVSNSDVVFNRAYAGSLRIEDEDLSFNTISVDTGVVQRCHGVGSGTAIPGRSLTGLVINGDVDT